MASADRPQLIRFLLLYAALYAGFGVQSPFLPSLLRERGLDATEIGLLLAAGNAIRLVTGPLAGRLADRRGDPQIVLAGAASLAACAAPFYLFAAGAWPLLLIMLIQSAALAPLAPLSDSLALGGAAPDARKRTGFDYGWVRGAGSGAFIAGSLLAGALITASGTGVIAGLNAALLALAAFCASFIRPSPSQAAEPERIDRGAIRGLLRDKSFRRMVLVAALILGSHAMHDGFAVIRWRAAGIGPETAGVLWSESVAAEVVMFLFLGSRLLDRLGVGGCMILASVTAALRWTVMGATSWVPAMALIEPLHGITFALLHLACMRLMAEIVPRHLAATALAIYGTLGIGAATTLVTLASGPLYGAFGAPAFWAMAALSLLALPFAVTLRRSPQGR